MALPENRSPIEKIGEEYVKQVRAGQDPNLEEMIAKYPEHEAEIRSFVAALSFVEKCKTK